MPYHPANRTRVAALSGFLLTAVLPCVGQAEPPDLFAARLTTAGDAEAVMGEAGRWGRMAYPLADRQAAERELAAGHIILLRPWPGGAFTSVTPAQPGRLAEVWQGSAQAFVLLIPGEIPATAEPAPYARAAAKLPPWEAVRAYDAGMAIWPATTDSLMGLGQGLAQLGDAQGAEAAFREARRLTVATPR